MAIPAIVGKIIEAAIKTGGAAAGAAGAAKTARSEAEIEAERITHTVEEDKANRKLKQQQLGFKGLETLATTRQAAQQQATKRSFNRDMKTAINNIQSGQQAPAAGNLPTTTLAPRPQRRG